ncbi:TPA: cysteine--tRNA ligase [Patescibacteria group bacterium]|uniref:Cysteine--tRNA ligase n=1 Tax=Candidatus Gottesmanbacteria bacterium GW2011_GWA1_43_11 TaxID=1618436 RepID=A0A0G1CEP2_9BACT|nr:MAG: cysteinyl-tRNA synthetase [Candidatus Gottesmanbacteria bacterium GW2011_GWA1_43_11]HCS79409.1 cysteine--tRNA ligase [Patescibacteria group bacterium]
MYNNTQVNDPLIFMLKLYNTLSRQIEDFIPLTDKKVGMYACGPTVYDYPHIGHIRRYVMDDVLVRLLRYLGFTVNHVMNITDVGHLVSDSDTGEDKLEKGARRENKTAWEVAKFYETEFFKTMDAMGIERPTIICRATEHIQEQIELVRKLEAKGFTYQIADGVYFDSTKLSDYGKLARLDIKNLQAGARVEPVPGKKHPTDFALWKFSSSPLTNINGLDIPVRQMQWYFEGPLKTQLVDRNNWIQLKQDENRKDSWFTTVGFPGWHIECSAMSMKYLGESFDLHTGGIDHIPVHHTNEIAQSEAATGKQYVKYWAHHNFLLVDLQKMSKSLGNFYTIDDVMKKRFTPAALRYLFLQTNYRQESNFTWEALSAGQTALNELTKQVTVIKQQKEAGERATMSPEKLQQLDDLRNRFTAALENDLNTPQAVSVIWELVKSNLPAQDKYDLLMTIDSLLGIGLNQVSGEAVVVPPEIQELAKQRETLRQQKQFAKADQVREKIEAKRWMVEDLPGGFAVKRKI